MAPLTLFAVAAPGLEEVVRRELEGLPGARGVRAVPGGVELAASAETMWRANLHVRTATRLLVRAGASRARDFARLVRDAGAVPWERYAPPGAKVAVRIDVATRRCRLYHTGAIAERVIAAIARRIPVDDAGEAVLHVLVRGEDDVFTMSVDSSGERLHRRGHRLETAKAPLRETLAAGALALARWDPRRPLVDPMCGSGTLVIEAALGALGRAPGAERGFAFQGWPGFSPERWAEIVAEARAAERSELLAPIAGSDRAPGAIAAARRNAERAGVAGHVRLQVGDARDLRLAELAPGAPPGLVVCNPPYGVRLGERRPGELRELYAGLGRLVRTAPGWRLAILATDRRLVAAIGPRPSAEHRLSSGGLRVGLYVFD